MHAAVRPGPRYRTPALAALVDAANEVLDDPDVDAGRAPHAAGYPRRPRASRARAGKHVLCEKPLAGDAGEAAALFEVAAPAERLLMAAPFVQLSPSFRRLWTLVQDGVIGPVHRLARTTGTGLELGQAGTSASPAATLGDAAIYNLKSLAALLGPVTEVTAAAATAAPRREVAGRTVEATRPGHLAGRAPPRGRRALVAFSPPTLPWRYRRPALELYGTEGTANLLGDDWDPRGIELLRAGSGSWELIEPEDMTWLWTDGLREAVMAVRRTVRRCRAGARRAPSRGHLGLVKACRRRAYQSRSAAAFPPSRRCGPSRRRRATCTTGPGPADEQ